VRALSPRRHEQVHITPRRDRQDTVRACDPLHQKRNRGRQVLVIGPYSRPVFQERRRDRGPAADEIVDADPECIRKSKQAAGTDLLAAARFNLCDRRDAEAD